MKTRLLTKVRRLPAASAYINKEAKRKLQVIHGNGPKWRGDISGIFRLTGDTVDLISGT